MDEVRRIISEEKKTPLILDASEDRKVATFFRFKGVLIDFSPLALPLRDKLRPKPKACMEEARCKASLWTCAVSSDLRKDARVQIVIF
jgi:hypothetical protein